LQTALTWIIALVFIVAGDLYVHAKSRYTCNACGSGISGAYFETKGVLYHPHHFICSHCSDPITGPYTTYRSSNYHDNCFRNHIARRCTLCNDVIAGQYIVDYWGNAYHLRHQKNASSCDFCDRFVTEDLLKGGVRFSDGRLLCRICHASAIKRIGTAKELMNEVTRHLKRIGMNLDDVDLRLHLIGIKKMQVLADHRSCDLRGVTDYHEEKNLFGRTKKRKIDVYLLYGMPRVEMIGTLAHELGHVWQFLNGRLHGDRALSEGSCNFTSYWVLKQIAPGEEGDFIIESMLRDEDKIYGEGFRRVKKYVEKNGISEWLALLVRDDPRLP